MSAKLCPFYDETRLFECGLTPVVMVISGAIVLPWLGYVGVMLLPALAVLLILTLLSFLR